MSSLPSYQEAIENLTNEVVSLRMNREQVNSGELHAALIWNDIADLDIHVVCPSGEELFYGHKESRCGGWLDVDANAGRVTLEPIENIFWASAPSGKYKIFVHNFNNRTDTKTVFIDSNRKVPFRVKLTKNDTIEWFSGSVSHKEKQTCFEFDFNGSGALGSFIILPEYHEKTTFQEHAQRHNVTYNKGTGFYALLKKEKVSKKKDVILYNKTNDTFDIGRQDVFTKLGLEQDQDLFITLKDIPNNSTLYVQSTSVNRGIPPGTKMLLKVGIREVLKYRRSDRYTQL
jgi:hypothetical protein